MRVVALLPWYDEQPAWLSATVASVARFCDHVVAVDGAYQLFPGGSGSSPLGQADAILETARASDMGVTVHVPVERWQGNEVEKRNYCLDVGRLERADWFFWIDSDMVVKKIPSDLRQRLEASERFVGHITLWQKLDLAESLDDGEPWHEIDANHPLFIRNIPNLRVVGNHWTWLGEADGRQVCVRGNRNIYDIEPAEDFRDVLVEHRGRLRERDRQKRARDYYQIRDTCGVERSSQTLMETTEGKLAVVA